MNRALSLLFCVIVCLLAASSTIAQTTDYFINHIAKNNWTTTITAYNDGPVDRTFTLYRYDADGMVTTKPDLLVPAQSALVLTSADFGYDGSAMVETPETESPLSIKLAYRYRESHSLCEFFIPDGAQATNWMLPNPFQSHFDWFGMAIANHGDYLFNELRADDAFQPLGQQLQQIVATVVSRIEFQALTCRIQQRVILKNENLAALFHDP